jgi:hypothetical protein
MPGAGNAPGHRHAGQVRRVSSRQGWVGPSQRRPARRGGDGIDHMLDLVVRHIAHQVFRGLLQAKSWSMKSGTTRGFT